MTSFRLCLEIVLVSSLFSMYADAVIIMPTNSPPGGLLPSQIPQIMVMSFDDSISSASWDCVQGVLTNHFNPNGNPIKATFFVSLDGKVDYCLIQNIYAAGNEIAVHTMSHTTDTNSTAATWRSEIVGCRKAISDLAQMKSSAFALRTFCRMTMPFVSSRKGTSSTTPLSRRMPAA